MRLIRNQKSKLLRRFVVVSFLKLPGTAIKYYFLYFAKEGAKRGKQRSVKSSWDVRTLKSKRKQTQNRDIYKNNIKSWNCLEVIILIMILY